MASMTWFRRMTFTLLLVLLPVSGFAGPYRNEPGILDALKKSTNSLIQGGNVFDLMGKGDVVNLEKLLKSHPKLAKERDFHQMTPLHLAPTKQIAKLLLDYGAEIDAPTYPKYDYQLTPLHMAIYRKNKEVALFLIDNGASLTAKSLSDITPLHEAAHQNLVEIVDALIKKGADINATCDHGDLTVPLYAAYYGQLETVKYFVDSGVAFDHAQAMFLNVTSNMGGRNNELNRYFLDICKVDPNARHKWDDTLLHAAASLFNPDLFQMLIDRGADPSLLDKEGRTVEECVLTDVSYALKSHPIEKARILKILKEYRERHSPKRK